ncbi:hypothetical protein SAVIM40S_04380 [Streptomyces avidinii]
MGGEEVGGQVDAVAVEVFTDVADEVGQLERLAESGCVRGGFFAGGHVAEDRNIWRPMTAAEPCM